MSNAFLELVGFLKTPFPYFFIILSLGISIILISDDNFFKSIYDKEEEIKSLQIRAENKFVHQDVEPEFVIHCGGTFRELELIENFAVGSALLFSTPATIATTIFIKALQIDYPDWSPNSFEFIAILAFIYFNANFGLLISYTLSLGHD